MLKFDALKFDAQKYDYPSRRSVVYGKKVWFARASLWLPRRDSTS